MKGTWSTKAQKGSHISLLYPNNKEYHVILKTKSLSFCQPEATDNTSDEMGSKKLMTQEIIF